MKTIIYGSTDTGRRIYDEVKSSTDVICFVDDNPAMWGGQIAGKEIRSPEEIKEAEFDEVIIGVLTYHMEVLEKLLSYGVPKQKINELYVNIPTHARIEALRNVRWLVDEENIQGSVAELGVFRGEFAKEINLLFPDRTLYLFDTFEGFSEQDTNIEVEKKYASKDKAGYFANTSEEFVLSQMPHPEKCVIKKGFFPETIYGIEDTFSFVNLDADLYAPTVAGLDFFYSRLNPGGVIFVHDFFSKAFLGVKDAVREFCSREGIPFIPIGDTLSVAIRKI